MIIPEKLDYERINTLNEVLMILASLNQEKRFYEILGEQLHFSLLFDRVINSIEQ